MTAPDPLAILRRAREIADCYDKDTREHLAIDPVNIVGSMSGITIEFRHLIEGGCDLDASYNSTNGTVTLDLNASLSRRRFSCLHELAHHDIDRNGELCDWLYSLGANQKVTLESLCDAFAAEILLPNAVIGTRLENKFGARQVASLFTEFAASREACIVRAAEHLRMPGLVILADSDGVVRFSSSRSISFRIGRGVRQEPESVIARAGLSGYATTNGRELVNLRTGRSFSEFRGDAFRHDDGYVFAVLRDDGDDVDIRGNSFENKKSWTCNGCHEDISGEDWCNLCSRKICPDCGCKCGIPKPKRALKYCDRCGLQIPLALKECPEHD